MLRSETYKAYFINPLPQELRADFDREIARQTRPLSTMLLIFIALLEGFNLGRILLTGRLARGSWINLTYFSLYLALLLATLAALAVLLAVRRDTARCARAYNRACFAYSLFFCLWSTGITLLDQRVSENITVYVAAVISVSVFVYLRPWQALVLFPVNHLVLLLFFTAFQGAPVNNTGNYLNSTVLCIVAVLLSLFRYHSKMADYQNRCTITGQAAEIQEINKQLRELVVTDTLSGLRNRRYLDAELYPRWEELLLLHRQIGVIMLDIDDFKRYNDIHGHQKGDDCIRLIAGVLAREAGAQAATILRYGGEEFTLILPGVSDTELMQTAEAIRRGVENLRLDNRPDTGLCWVTVSEGVFWCRAEEPLTLEQCLKRADDALYEAKRQGKNRVAAAGAPVCSLV